MGGASSAPKPDYSLKTGKPFIPDLVVDSPAQDYLDHLKDLEAKRIAKEKARQKRIQAARRARAEKKRIAAVKAKEARLRASRTFIGTQQKVVPKVYQPTGNKASWLRASGIPESQWALVDWLVSRESGWNPCAYYPGQSNCNASPTTACGLIQQNPCGKIAGHWTDPVAALKWQYNYVNSRYGGYAGAVAWWKAHNSY